MPALQVATLDAIRDPILDILRHSDLSSISAKKVRQALAEQDDARFPDQKLLRRLQVNLGDKEHKRDVDDLIRQCFDIVNKGNGAGTGAAGASQTSTSNGHANGGSPSSSTTAGRLVLPGAGGIPGSHAQSDVPSRDRPASSSSSAAAPASKRSRKSDVISDDEEDIDPAALRAKAKKQASTKTTKKKRKSAADDGTEKAPPNPNNPFNKPVVLSDAMSQVCGGKEMPRYMITKQLWAYIKGNELQNPDNKRQIMCDDTLSKLFGKSTVDSFEMAKLISQHVTKKTD